MTQTWRMPAASLSWRDVLNRGGVVVRQVGPFGPCGVRGVIVDDDDMPLGSIIVTQAEHDGMEWLHASIAYADRDPTYGELALLHRAVFGRKRYSYQAFVPEDEHVNIHEHALHLWGLVDGHRLTPQAFGTI